MRFVPGILSVLLLCAGSVSALAADARIGFVDMRVVMSKSKVADKAKKSFEQSVSVESKKINDEKKRLQTSVENLRRDSAIMSEAELQKKQQSLRGELLELQKKEKAAVGEIGEQRTQLNNQIMGQVAEHLRCGPSEVMVSSTGVIGVPLPKDKAREGVANALTAELCGWEDVAATINTTDTFNKGAHASAILGENRVELCGVIKGSGMIAPDMATMLGYIFTDADVEPAFLQELLSAANLQTFSCITVDGDTSTSDTVLVFATGKAGNAKITGWDSPGADALAAPC